MSFANLKLSLLCCCINYQFICWYDYDGWLVVELDNHVVGTRLPVRSKGTADQYLMFTGILVPPYTVPVLFYYFFQRYYIYRYGSVAVGKQKTNWLWAKGADSGGQRGRIQLGNPKVVVCATHKARFGRYRSTKSWASTRVPAVQVPGRRTAGHRSGA